MEAEYQNIRKKRAQKGEEHMNKEMTVNGKSYTIIKLLGKGKGGYSYLAESGNNRYVLK